MFCDYCGAKLPDDSVFCSACGARLMPLTDTPPMPEPEAAPDVPPMPGSWPGNPMPPSGGPFTRTQTMTEAARLAIERNPVGAWSWWDSPARFTEDEKKLLRGCEKEDRYIASFDDRNGVQYYVVSPDGAIGQAYLDDSDGALLLEWMYYTPSRAPEELPSTPDEL